MNSTLPTAEQLLAAIAHRRSMGLSRIDPEKPVDVELIEMMIQAANWGQSHNDTEPWRFTVFAGKGREKLAEIYGNYYKQAHPDDFKPEAYEASKNRAFLAPVWISIGMEPGRNEDGSLMMTEAEELMAVATAVQNLHLMASGFGLAGMWHSKGVSISPYVADELGLVAPAKLLGFFFFGWPSGEWMEGERKPWQDKVRMVLE
jgi:nitroreductase